MLVIIMAQLRKHFPNCENIFSENYKQYASTGQYYGPAFMPKTRKKETRSNEHWKLFVILEKSVQYKVELKKWRCAIFTLLLSRIQQPPRKVDHWTISLMLILIP